MKGKSTLLNVYKVNTSMYETYFYGQHWMVCVNEFVLLLKQT